MKSDVANSRTDVDIDIFEQTRAKLVRAKNTYQNALIQVDGDLRRLVSQDPSRLPDARAIQSGYTDDIEAVDLEAAEQPAAPSEPKRKKRKAYATATGGKLPKGTRTARLSASDVGPNAKVTKKRKAKAPTKR